MKWAYGELEVWLPSVSVSSLTFGAAKGSATFVEYGEGGKPTKLNPDQYRD